MKHKITHIVLFTHNNKLAVAVSRFGQSYKKGKNYYSISKSSAKRIDDFIHSSRAKTSPIIYFGGIELTIYNPGVALF